MSTGPSSTKPVKPAGRRRAGRLASAGVIREAATTLFLRNGYLGTTMDEIAALAGVSKQTVYTHFPDKEGLFSDLIRGNNERVDEFVEEIDRLLPDSTDLERDLRELARRYVASVIQTPVVQLRRLVIGEAGRFPDLARAYYERVPQRVIETLAGHLRRLAGRGLLTVDDPLVAASHFAWLVLATPLDRSMFYGPAEALSTAELERLADAGVRVFLAAYGRR